VLNPRVSTDKTIVERFRREAIACGRLNHPNVIFVSDFGFKEGVGIYIIMEYIEGESLMDLLKREKVFEVGIACQIALQICDALEAAHQLGIVHRDLKPANILVSSVVGHSHHVKVLDFGIALLKDQQNLTAAGLTVGSPHYMSPEQIQGRSDLVGPTSDIYSLGVLLYQMLTGKWPIYHKDLMMLCHMQLTHVPDLISVSRPEMAGSHLEKLVASMLAKAIEDRPVSMQEVTAELNDALADFQQPVAEVKQERTEIFKPGRYQILNIVHTLRQSCAGSPLLEQIDQIPGLMEFDGKMFVAMVWGLVSCELSKENATNEELKLSAQSTAVLVESHINSEESSVESPFLASVAVTMRGLEKHQQRALVEALQPLLNHAKFPVDLIPDWARVHTSGTWKNPLIPNQFSTVRISAITKPKEEEDSTTLVKLDEQKEDSGEAQAKPESNFRDLWKSWKR